MSIPQVVIQFRMEIIEDPEVVSIFPVCRHKNLFSNDTSSSRGSVVVEATLDESRDAKGLVFSSEHAPRPKHSLRNDEAFHDVTNQAI